MTRYKTVKRFFLLGRRTNNNAYGSSSISLYYIYFHKQREGEYRLSLMMWRVERLFRLLIFLIFRFLPKLHMQQTREKEKKEKKALSLEGRGEPAT